MKTGTNNIAFQGMNNKLYYAQVVILRAIDVFHVVTFEMLKNLGTNADPLALRKGLQVLKRSKVIQCSENGNFYFCKDNPDVDQDRIAAYWVISQRKGVTPDAIKTLRNEEYPALIGFNHGNTRYIISVLDEMGCERDTSIMRRTLYDMPQNHIFYVLPDKELLQKVIPPRYAKYTCAVLEMNHQSIFKLPAQIKYFEPILETNNEESDDGLPQ